MTSPILVVALNPALDVTHHLSSVDWGGVNRPAEVRARPGGKGLNVAFTLRALGASVRVVGLAGGSTGAAIRDGAAQGGVTAALTPIAGETRRTFTVVDAQRARTAAFYEPGPDVSVAEYAAFEADYAAELAGAGVVVLTGSLPPGLGPASYAALIRLAARAGVPAVLDAGGNALRLGAAARPTVIKPNLAELEQAAGRSLRAGPGHSGTEDSRTDDSGTEDAGAPYGRAEGNGDAPADLRAVAAAARDLMTAGAQAAVVSLGPGGLLALTESGCWHVTAPDVTVRNPTGAGDAVVAGLALGLARGWAWPDRLRHAAALGTATVASPVGGEFDRAEYERLCSDVRVPGLRGL